MIGKNTLGKQLLSVIGIVFLLLFVSLGAILPRILNPVVESNIYNYLKEPLQIYDTASEIQLADSQIAYIYITDNHKTTSDNILDVIPYDQLEDIVMRMNHSQGKFLYKRKVYYYYKIEEDHITKIALTNDRYMNYAKTSILSAIFPLLLGTFLLMGIIIVLWSSILVKKIERLKNKIDHIDDTSYNHKIDFHTDDEIRSLALAIEDMRLSLIHQEEYRNQMYQNISHDFKTPLSVIKSYIEACEDGVETKDVALAVIKDQTAKLEQKVHSLLYLNKLDYLKNSQNYSTELVDMEKIIKEEVEKFKFQRKDILFSTNVDKKSKYYGSAENWETILDNLLSNFLRYAKKEIKINVKTNKIILYNDGDQIDEDFLEVIFTPFRKGMKGEFGLGLAIVKKTLNVMGYDIEIKNEKKGVSFIITSMKGSHK